MPKSYWWNSQAWYATISLDYGKQTIWTDHSTLSIRLNHLKLKQPGYGLNQAKHLYAVSYFYVDTNVKLWHFCFHHSFVLLLPKQVKNCHLLLFYVSDIQCISKNTNVVLDMHVNPLYKVYPNKGILTWTVRFRVFQPFSETVTVPSLMTLVRAVEKSKAN